MPFRHALAGLALASLLIVPTSTFAATQTGSFKDVPTSDPGYEAIEFLHAKGILDGYQDGTFKPDQTVNRAEALKIIAGSLMSDSQKSGQFKSPYTDVPDGAWYVPYVEWSRQQLKIIDGPPKTTRFHPGNPVTKAEFLKMLFLAQSIDPNYYSEVTLPLSADVTDAKQWYYPYLRFAISAAVTSPNANGLLSPNRTLTRDDVAILLYRLQKYREGARTQALLTLAQNDLVSVLTALEKSDVRTAEQASARALLESRGANHVDPKEALVKAVVKVTEGFRSLVRAYQAGVAGKLDDAIKLSQDAYFSGTQAKQLSPEIKTVATQLQGYATTLAKSARAKKAGK